jgi:hypothetical protein
MYGPNFSDEDWYKSAKFPDHANDLTYDFTAWWDELRNHYQ